VESSIVTLLHRIERLEASNVRQRAVLLITLALCAVFAFTAAIPPARMYLLGPNGHRVMITYDNMTFSDSSGKEGSVSLGFSSLGVPSLSITDASGKNATLGTGGVVLGAGHNP
jgi:hypothetical protein